MNYAEAVAHLYALGPELSASKYVANPALRPAPRKFDLAHMRVLCAALGNPERRVPAVLIAGTNGKGSTAATLASILQAAGYRTGLYTSPHLIRINERIQLSRGGVLTPIEDAEFARLYGLVDEACTGLDGVAAAVAGSPALRCSLALAGSFALAGSLTALPNFHIMKVTFI